MKPYLGPAQLHVLGLILDGQARGHPPSLQEIADRLDCCIHNAAQLLDRLALKGLVTWEEKQARTLRPTCRYIPERYLVAPDDRPLGVTS